ncbi:selenocysteine-specific translation elongation factor [Aneurinibacillus sp. Ricciae_BoGa-3]|uniref:selenocysteine-specific translation elongation factor n=1 Tax=Aneurinibacillus sp. Ricciae_BoGa-3 TaxID=3022697 RepID=UPI0023400079|nr:selenocysteine-specific translation elongation factor [Aneurinibacillus sp. Ricciae_BoGa-3]WCK54761.1 selenocysteine-specific translation elongation factor [Aneurinibacillus sp. Ricciae_BoGa-3]
MIDNSEGLRHTIGIAGHIDHGKTSLTRQLTGIDTDRLKEEKERSISIELGFAPFKLPDGKTIGVVDVPGHERFIRQMIAGAAGIDLVVLVIAADEGVMPQTQEHTDILGYLGIERGIIVLTKADTVDDEWLELVKQETAEWASGTFLAGAPMLAVSSKTGAGIGELRLMIERELERIPPRSSQAPFRMPIDRSFHIKGAGTVVTGTVYEGKAVEGDVLELLPEGMTVRVRQLHEHSRQVDGVFAGQRAAINIAGTDTAARGMTLASPGYFKATQRIDVLLSSLPNQELPLKQRSRVRLHIGTAEVIGKVIFYDRNTMQHGETAACQLELQEPIAAKKGEPFIVRRLSPAETIGGGQVLDPYASRHRFGQATADRLNKLAQGEPAELLVQVLERALYTDIQGLSKQLAVNEEEMKQLVLKMAEEGEIRLLGGRLEQSAHQPFVVLAHTLDIWKEQIQHELAEYHAKHPMRPGMKKASLQSALFQNLPDRLWRYIIEEMDSTGVIKESQEWICLTGFSPSFPASRRSAIEDALRELRNAGLTPPAWTVLMDKHSIAEHLAGDLKALLLNRTEILQLEDDLYIYKAEWDKGVQTLRSKTEQSQTITPAVVREILGLSRKFMIPLLESLDRNKLTKRVEDGRVWLDQGNRKPEQKN